MTTAGRQVSSTDPGLTIRQVSDLLNIPAPTLRSWERRYAIPVTSRSAGGHRRYLPDELNQLRLMRDEVARGKRAADAAFSVRLLLDQDNPALPWIKRLLVESEASSSTGIRLMLDQAWAELGLAATLDDVLMPAMRQMGAWWESGRCDVPQEHLMTESSRAWLARLITFAPVETYEPPILLACGPKELHTIGLEGLAALLGEQRRGCRILGARTSELTLVTAAASPPAAAVVVVSQLHTHRRAAVDALRAVDRLGCPVFYAGNAFAFPGRRAGVPGTYLGENLSKACTVILESLLGVRPARRFRNGRPDLLGLPMRDAAQPDTFEVT